MSDFHDQALIRRLERVAEVKPDPEATRRAMERVRRLLTTTPPRPTLWRMIMLRRLSIAAAILLAAGGGLFWLLASPAPAGATFALVQAAMKSSRSVSWRQVVLAEGQPARTTRLWALDNGLCRAGESDGSYSIMDSRKYRALAINPKERKALLFEGMNTPQLNFYELLKTLPGDASARPLPGKKIDGKAVLGFAVKVEGHDFTVWADAATRLPVRIELEEKDAAGKTGSAVMDEFVFDKELDPKLFSFEPPAGLKLEIRGNASQLPAPPSAPELKSPVVTPLVGIGPVKFGMSRAVVEKLLGIPDFVEERGKAGYVDMSYGSRGFFIGVSRTLGVVMISCVAQKTMATRVHDFTGKTDKEIALGASQAAITKAYGEPTSKRTNMGSTYLSYAKIQADFTFWGDELVQMLFMRQRQPKP
jgi:hypothetical protein